MDARAAAASGCHRSRSSTTRATSPIATASVLGVHRRQHGDRAVGVPLRRRGGGPGPDEAFKAVLGVDERAVEALARGGVCRLQADRGDHEDAGAIARPVINRETAGGDLNVGPELSPDGSKVMFFSEKDLFSIDLFMADAATARSFADHRHRHRSAFREPAVPLRRREPGIRAARSSFSRGSAGSRSW